MTTYEHKDWYLTSYPLIAYWWYGIYSYVVLPYEEKAQ